MEKEEACMRLGILGEKIWGGTVQSILSDQEINDIQLLIDTGDSSADNRDFIILTDSYIIRLICSQDAVSFMKLSRKQTLIKVEKSLRQ